METKIIYAFSNPVRLKLLCCLNQKSSNVEELIKSCGLAQSAVSQHLAKLKKANLVKTDKRGRFIYYSLANKEVGEFANQFYKYVKSKN